LQPQSEIRLVRAYLEQEGWQIANENLVLEDGKYYPMMRAVHREDGQEAAMSQTELRYGPLLLAQCHPLLEQFLHREWQVQTRILDSLAAQTSEASGKRRQEVEQELLYLKEALNVFGG
jgi:tRNA (adenine22-N1)-methyltransferase